jgi:diaminopimelate decarboxylase
MIHPSGGKSIVPSTLSASAMSKVLELALASKDLINAEDTAIIFYDLDLIKERIMELQKLFPPATLHAVAIKANPLTGILKKVLATGAGLEAASLPELYLAEAAGFLPKQIVFDSPCKTINEIEYALTTGINLNADSFDELGRIAAILETTNSDSIIGVRINPQVGSGSIASTGVSGRVSKFGIPLINNAEKLKVYFKKHPWLTAVHVHIGSQGYPVALMIEGVRKILDFAIDVNKQSMHPQIKIFDLGGGMPVSYHPDKIALPMEAYLDLLMEHCKELFSGQFKLVTEFGRYIYANAGWVVSKVEYVKNEKDHSIIMTHAGADLFLRECYHPADWHHEISAVNKTGHLKTGTKNNYIIAGPLCFAGDIIARNVELPEVNEGDYILIHDAGAYTLSMWSRYNSRQVPAVIGYSAMASFEILKERESKEAVLKFWS